MASGYSIRDTGNALNDQLIIRPLAKVENPPENKFSFLIAQVD